jgi:hypothetical protein
MNYYMITYVFRRGAPRSLYSTTRYSTKADANAAIRRLKETYPGRAFKVFSVPITGFVSKRNNPRPLLFRTRASALKYAREHGAKRFSIRKVKAGR